MYLNKIRGRKVSKRGSYMSEQSIEPTVSLAIQNQLKNAPHYKDPATGLLKRFSVWRYSFAQFADLGIGVYLYFEFLQQLAIVFGVMFICVLPLKSIFFFFANEYIKPKKKYHTREIPRSQLGFEQTTIGNLGSPNTTAEIVYPFAFPGLGTNTISKKKQGLSTLIFLCFLEIVKHKQENTARNLEEKITTIADFSVRIGKLPPDFYNRHELQRWCEERWGEVAEVAMLLCYNDGDITAMYMEKSELVQQKRVLEKKGVNTEELGTILSKISKLDAKISAFKQSYVYPLKKILCLRKQVIKKKKKI
ncbi:hypothetical protein RFI_24253 [Reticulomyxa filosa]|uniref:Uncharacterized protein n=1 Tax=Reticulomyxa filosa TaxID=46433 RepID=X6MI62_RETFI|nr:hypothetical protein RFI_24253 [Reticulomyxa filosa]|eukprot:ETO13122.1 hypothetical protein RFI_24253 [Reticulomyxa filosa]